MALLSPNHAGFGRAATRLAFTVAAAALLSGCGVVYTSQRVDPVAAERSAAGVGVDVVPMTLEAAVSANAEAYQPRTLPDVFTPTAEETPRMPHLGPRSVTPSLMTASGPPVLLDPDAASLTRRLPPVTEPEPYRVGSGDVLSVALASPAALNDTADSGGVTAVRVQDSGAAVLPEIGLVQVGGLTLDEIQAEILAQLARRRIDREVTVDIAGFNSQRVAIAGAVRSPSVKPITISGLTLDEAIAASGGLDRVETRYGVILLNRAGETYRIPVEDFVSDAAMRGLPLKDGDSLFVDRRYDAIAARDFFQLQVAERSAQLTERQMAQADAQMALNFANARQQNAQAARAEAREAFRARLEFGAEPRDFVYVGGEVGKQQRIGMPFDGVFTLADVLFAADGIDVITGDPSEIYVIRRPLAGSGAEDRLTAFHLDAGNAAYLSLATLFEMRPSDVVFVEAQPISEWNRVLTQAVPFLTAAETGLGFGKD